MSTRLALVASILLLQACTMIGPTVQVQPAPGRSPDVFAEDRRGCMKVTDASVQPMANQLNVTGLARNVSQIAADNDRIQDAYNASYGQCMAARGNIVAMPVVEQAVPVSAPASPSRSTNRGAVTGGAASAEAAF